MTRRRRRVRGRPAVLIAATVLVVVILHPVILALLVVPGAVWAGVRYRHLFRRPNRPPAALRPRQPAVTAAPRPRPGDAQARRNGWIPPARPRVVLVGLTPECASGECAFCPGGDCGCPCGHNAKVIVAMNKARDDDAPPPF